MAGRDTSRTRLNWPLMALLAYGVVFTVGLRLLPFSAFNARAFDDFGQIGAAALASAFCAYAALRGRGRIRWAWASLGAGTASWAFGGAVWATYEVVLRVDTPFPSWADAGYLGMLPLTLAGLILLAPTDRALLRGQTVLDGVALVMAAAAVIWLVSLRDIYEASDTSTLEKAIGGAYPLGDLVLFFGVFVASHRQRSGEAGTVLALFSAGLALFMLSDVGFAYETLNETYATGSLVDFGWPFGFLLMGYGASIQAASRPDRAAGETARGAVAWRQALPLSLILLTFAELRLADATGSLDVPLVVMAGTVFVAVVIRQGLVLRDNAILNGEIAAANDTLARIGEELECRVAQRTEELSRLASILDTTTDFVGTFDMQGNVLYMNQAGRRMVGIAADADVSAMKIADMQPPWALDIVSREGVPAALRDGVWSGDTAVVAPDGRQTPVSQVIIAHRTSDGAPEFLSTVARDVTESKEFQSRLTQLANHDGLTDLFNRRRFEEEVETELARIRRFGASAAVLFIDLDGFKYINDDLGHRAGDELLVSLALVLSGELRETDVLARLGGDEFALLLAGTTEAEATVIAERINAVIRAHRVVVHEQPVSVTASIGIAMAPLHASTVEDLLTRADMAMYLAKESRDSTRMYLDSDASQANFSTTRIWEQRIRTALDEGLFVLHAQPIVDLVSGSTQYELLIRMQGENGELIQPASFLPIAERSSLIHEIDRWVVCEAIDMLAAHQARGEALAIEVNLSGKAFADEGLLPLLQERLAATRIDASKLVLEITETAAISNITHAQHFIASLKALGCKFAIDDFGVGFSSFYYLKNLPVDYLKIDGSFIRNLPRDAADQHLVRSMVELARGLGKRTIAEFVGDQLTVELLRLYGVDAGQGYFLGEPRALSEYETQTGSLAA